MDLSEDIKGFTLKEIKQYHDLTVAVLNHSLNMLKNDKLVGNLRMAVEMSIKQSEEDLEFLEKTIEDRKKNGEDVSQQELSAQHTNDELGEMAGEEDNE